MLISAPKNRSGSSNRAFSYANLPAHTGFATLLPLGVDCLTFGVKSRWGQQSRDRHNAPWGSSESRLAHTQENVSSNLTGATKPQQTAHKKSLGHRLALLVYASLKDPTNRKSGYQHYRRSLTG